MSFLNYSQTTSSFLTINIFNDSTLSLNTSIAEVPSSLQWTRFVVQTVLTPIVVIIGLLGNMLNILVLLQPSMRTSTNIYILVLSFADSVFLVFNFALSFLDCRKRGLSDAAYHFNPYGRFLSNFSGNVAVWVTVSFTVERYIAVCYPMRGKVWCTVHRAKLASLGVTFLALINTIPTIFELKVVETEKGLRCMPSQLAESMFYSWWYVTLFTFIPLVCLAFFNMFLMKVLFAASKNRQKLAMIQTASPASKSNLSQEHLSQYGSKEQRNFGQKSLTLSYRNNVEDDEVSQPLRSHSPSEVFTCDGHSCSQGAQSSLHGTNQNSNFWKRNLGNGSVQKIGSRDYVSKRQNKRMSREQHKVTLLLVTIVMIFLLCQLPWTALFLYTTYLDSNKLTGNDTHIKIAGNICNLLVLINSSVNFYLYSCFSKRFRQTLTALILFWRRKSLSIPAIV